ncbi:MAG: putative toxin-antitoxin system toxin component, PIN family [Nitrospira sp.]|nr:putative toxin-antitoxin system toxin component, PIN family [Nitrospira sp.]
MITAVADTNIYISAILFGGPCEAILGMARAGLIELYHSPAIERELRRILHEKFQWSELQVQDMVKELQAISQPILPTLHLSGIVQDDTDHRILECAVAAQADYLITGDKRHLQPLNHFRGVTIISPRAFLSLFV